MDANIETIKAVTDVAKVLSVTALLWLALYGNLKGWWVSGREFKAVCNERDRLRTRFDALFDSTVSTLDHIAADGREHPGPR